MLPDEFSDFQMINALETMWNDPERREILGRQARQVVLTRHAPLNCVDKYMEAIENAYWRGKRGVPGLLSDLANLEKVPHKSDLLLTAQSIARSIPVKAPTRQLLVDVSELVQRESKTEYQRVVCNILRQLLLNPPEGYRIEPVYATLDNIGYFYARQFTLRFLGCPEDALKDEPIDWQPEDIFLGLDLQPAMVSAQSVILDQLRQWGLRVWFLVFDLLPIRHPEWFLPGNFEGFERWLSVVTQAEGAICISRATADDLRNWCLEKKLSRLRSYNIEVSYLGANLESSSSSRGMPLDASSVLDKLKKHPSFLMIGPLEPRKGHMQVLLAFEQLWGECMNANLIIVGKQGWMVEELIERLRQHTELGNRLFWLEDISDEYMENIYAASTCLIAASEGEGFGLPLIEAAQHNLPIIARDIPVFREVAGEHAFYFSGSDSQELSATIKRWLALYDKGEQPKIKDMSWLTWEQSANRLKEILLENA